MACDYEIYDYLERTDSPDPADPVLLDRVRYFPSKSRAASTLSEFINELTEVSEREWRVDEFALRPRPRRARITPGTTTKRNPEGSDPAA